MIFRWLKNNSLENSTWSLMENKLPKLKRHAVVLYLPPDYIVQRLDIHVIATDYVANIGVQRTQE